MIGDLCKLVPKGMKRFVDFLREEQFDAVVKKWIPEGLDGIDAFQYEPVKREKRILF